MAGNGGTKRVGVVLLEIMTTPDVTFSLRLIFHVYKKVDILQREKTREQIELPQLEINPCGCIQIGPRMHLSGGRLTC